MDGAIALLLLLRSLSLLADEALVDMRDDSASGDGRLDERVQLLVTTDGELQVARRDTLHLQILGRVAGQLEDLNREIRARYQRNIMNKLQPRQNLNLTI